MTDILRIWINRKNKIFIRLTLRFG